MTIWWYLTRSTGIVATVLAFGAIIWGTRFAGRATGTRLRPNWWLDLHNHERHGSENSRPQAEERPDQQPRGSSFED